MGDTAAHTGRVEERVTHQPQLLLCVLGRTILTDAGCRCRALRSPEDRSGNQRGILGQINRNEEVGHVGGEARVNDDKWVGEWWEVYGQGHLLFS